MAGAAGPTQGHGGPGAGVDPGGIILLHAGEGGGEVEERAGIDERLGVGRFLEVGRAERIDGFFGRRCFWGVDSRLGFHGHPLRLCQQRLWPVAGFRQAQVMP